MFENINIPGFEALTLDKKESNVKKDLFIKKNSSEISSIINA